MRQRVRLVVVMLLIGACASPAYAGDDGPARAVKENAQLRKQVREMQAQLKQMQQRLDALEARLGAGGRAPVSPTPGPAVAGNAAPRTPAPGAPPPGVVAAGVPLPAPSPAGVSMGAALKGLLPGPVSGPTARRIGAEARAGGPPEGVIMPSLQGVPKVFIPDIGAVGDFTLRQSDLRPGDPRYNPADDQFHVRDTQIILFSPIDPYTNAQISIDKPNGSPFDVEEAFLVFNKLPWDLSLRAGQFRPNFGLINETDTFQLPMVNRPLALTQYIGDDGFVMPGVNLSAYVPNPWDADVKADVNMLSGGNTPAFPRSNTFDFAYMGSLTYSRDLFGSGAMLGGVSAVGGPGPGGQSYFQDPFLQIQYAPTQRQVWTWSNEALLAERQGVGDHGLKRGFYSLLDYNFWLRYHAGFLFDMADVPGVPSGTQAAVSPIFTYFVSDNTRLRFQYTHETGSGAERAADFFYGQATFSLGNLKPLE